MVASTIIPIPKRQLLSSTSSMNSFNTRKVNGDTSTIPIPSSSKSNRKVKFEGDAHEVPSGPNPISNRPRVLLPLIRRKEAANDGWLAELASVEEKRDSQGELLNIS
ncbi:hypothetical protein POM88_049191 [Heracleum sosnowskyi]|uniref:Uncharacterized protein n=1 Tax=Heracleum sosnowskyi TaxID=360622 RepID=A0AAD8LZA0_9APIA|nr:hypothetical protein POM88_049191 [Heracleum sosnowskyi]